MFDWDKKASNAILLDENVGGKGRKFQTRFLQAGLVKYSFGVCLLDKEVMDKFVYQFEGCPVIINHKDVTAESAKDDRVGVISRVWFDQFDGWYWGEGVIFEQEALDLIDKGYSVSCQYEITEYSSNGGIHNGNEYDKVILNGKPEHLAIVANPRYENAMIAVNAMDVENGGEGSGIKGHTTNKPIHVIVKRIKDLEAKLDNIKKSDTSDSDEHKNCNQQAQDKIIAEIADLKKQLPAKNDIIQAINDIKESTMFKNLFKKKEKQMDKDEMKALFMECLTELTAANEADKKEEVKEEKKEEKKEEEEVAENKCKNEEPDYKKLYNELKAEVDKAKNEEETKAKNSVDEQKEMFASNEAETKIEYITEKRARELGRELF